jgi:integrase/recombinase XerD
LAEPSADVAVEFAEWLRSEGRAENTVAAYRRDVVAYLQWATRRQAPSLAAYVEHLQATRQPSSAARAVVALRVFHRWRGLDDAAAERDLGGLPITAATPEPAPLTEDAVAALLDACSGESIERRRDAAAIGLLYFAGLKATEAISLDLADVGPDELTLIVDRDGPHERMLPVVPALQEALAQWVHERGRSRLSPSTPAVLVNRRGQRLTRQGLWLLTGAVARRIGMTSALSPNDLRRASAVHLARGGVPGPAITAFLGHARGAAPTARMLNEAGWGRCNLLA